MSEEETSLKDEIKKMSQNFETLISEGKAKKFKLPLKANVNKTKAKENYAGICYINENREVKFIKLPIKEGGIIVDGQPHLATPEYTLTYKNKPFIIVPSWNLKPFSPEENFDDAIRGKHTSHGHRLLLNIMKNETLQLKKKLGLGALGLGILVIGVIGYLVTRNGGVGG